MGLVQPLCRPLTACFTVEVARNVGMHGGRVDDVLRRQDLFLISLSSHVPCPPKMSYESFFERFLGRFGEFGDRFASFLHCSFRLFDVCRLRESFSASASFDRSKDYQQTNSKVFLKTLKKVDTLILHVGAHLPRS